MNACSPQKPSFELGIMFTHTCNIACRHCGILSHPKNRNRMAEPDLMALIDDAAALPEPPDLIVFTGGEPFVHPDTLARALRRCRDQGMPTRVVTNGFWARDVGQGLDVLMRMQEAGLNALNFSADVWHLEFMEAQTLHNAIDCAQLLGFHVVVNMAVLDDTDVVDQFCTLYGFQRTRVQALDQAEFFKAQTDIDLSHKLLEKIHLSWGRVVRLGRAEQEISDFNPKPLSYYANGGCNEVINRPVIYPDGDLQACCCAGGKIASFRVGNIHDRPMSDLLADMRQRSHFRYINAVGPKALHRALAQAKGVTPDEKAFCSICDVCVKLADQLAAKEVDEICEVDVLRRLVMAGESLAPEQIVER